jgi:hypothetical protein
MGNMQCLRDLLDILDEAGVQYLIGSGSPGSMLVYFTMVGARGIIEIGDGSSKLVCFAGTETVSNDNDALAALIAGGRVASRSAP